MATHELIAKPDTVHWGFYDASLEPVMRIRSGDTLEVHTESGREEYLAELGEPGIPKFKRYYCAGSPGTWSTYHDGSRGRRRRATRRRARSPHS